MAPSKHKVMLVGYFGVGALECSFNTAFIDIGCEVSCFDISSSVQANCRFGRAGQIFNKFVPVDAWVRKANREMVLEARRFMPDVLVVFGQNPVQAGALAQIRSMMDLKTVYIWPDTLVNLSASMISVLPLYDLVATYSNSTVRLFERLGAKDVKWVPLAADTKMHSVPDNLQNTATGSIADVAFIGQWRPERERAIAAILHASPNINLKIWGPDWGRRCKGKPNILKSWQGRPLYAQEFAATVALSKINLNIIDDTNYPAANMRFFEIPCAGGLQVCSQCPEMEDEFKHGETAFYYRSMGELPEMVRSLLKNDSLRKHVAQKANEIILKKHTYIHRVGQILDLLFSS
ncbi:MAG: glycosyltransferase [Oryzomonas sp.]|uniref:CgeB family protein n=1 Tax=Oryzomonas sp. TaxID=2855186 RepID=UPI002850971E|nr:glycosyltransferase [Oryzomonas sp.]MDR3580284.1 glycosyltransferase [Oryzomonas sp.]